MPFLPRLLIHSACFDWRRHWNRLPLRPLSPCITKKWQPVKVSARSRRFLIHWKIGDLKQSTMCQRSKLPVVLTSRVLLFYNYIFTVVIWLLLDIPLACHATCQSILLYEQLKLIKPQHCATRPTLFILIKTFVQSKSFFKGIFLEKMTQHSYWGTCGG